MMNKLIKTFAVISSALVGACGIHQAKPIQGVVQDSLTNEPINNALIIAEWRLVSGFFHPVEAGVASIQEARTDEKGHFTIPGWQTSLVLNSVARNAPEVRIYKPGYFLGYFPNKSGDSSYRFSLDSSWSGDTFLLNPQKEDSNLQNQINTLESLANIFTYRWGKEPCFWERVPQTSAVVVEAKIKFSENNISNRLPRIESFSGKGCSDPMVVLKEYMQ